MKNENSIKTEAENMTNLANLKRAQQKDKKRKNKQKLSAFIKERITAFPIDSHIKAVMKDIKICVEEGDDRWVDAGLTHQGPEMYAYSIPDDLREFYIEAALAIFKGVAAKIAKKMKSKGFKVTLHKPEYHDSYDHDTYTSDTSLHISISVEW